ncbi:hypothetical protein T4B_9835 [Trichinella pseudospiralis]|uniref:Uncharacterized protein n=1 Tax=Trichinella pseudospiralis TaxID=6337 RepID=A0A0V1ILT2_TRIPS|nr:hypothetical protein T4B_9835 [Trichinella pseudospiralis]
MFKIIKLCSLNKQFEDDFGTLIVHRRFIEFGMGILVELVKCLAELGLHPLSEVIDCLQEEISCTEYFSFCVLKVTLCKVNIQV